MKHIKIFEEFDILPGEENSPLDFTENEINFLKIKTDFYGDIEDLDPYYINAQKIDKTSDGWYLLNDRVKCSSLTEAIRQSERLYKEMFEYTDKIMEDIRVRKFTPDGGQGEHQIYYKGDKDRMIEEYIRILYNDEAYRISWIFHQQLQQAFECDRESVKLFLIKYLNEYFNNDNYYAYLS